MGHSGSGRHHKSDSTLCVDNSLRKKRQQQRRCVVYLVELLADDFCLTRHLIRSLVVTCQFSFQSLLGFAPHSFYMQDSGGCVQCAHQQQQQHWGPAGTDARFVEGWHHYHEAHEDSAAEVAGAAAECGG